MERAANWNRRQWFLPRLQVLNVSSDLPNSAEGFCYIHTYSSRNLTFSIFNQINYCCCYHHIIGSSPECGLLIVFLNLSETVCL
jgi:hypothetical protein